MSTTEPSDFALRMQQRHNKEQLEAEKHGKPHTVTIEDAVDEEDLAHPPLSAITSTPSGPVLQDNNKDNAAPFSEKAAGKQKVQDGGKPTTPKPSIDTKSETAFPALGGGVKPRATGPVASAWGAKQSTPLSNGAADGANGHGRGPGAQVPSSQATRPIAAGIPNVQIQTKGSLMAKPESDHVHFAPHELLKKGELKKPISEILREVNKKSNKAKIEQTYGTDGGLTFVSRGDNVEAGRQALKELAKQVGSKQTINVPVPLSARPHIIGKQGATIQNIQSRSGARVNFPKADEIPSGPDVDENTLINVVIEGDAVSARLAKRDIQEIIDARNSTMNVRLRDIPAELYPFIAGPHNISIDRLQEERGVAIKVPHYYSWIGEPPVAATEPDAAPSFRPHPTNHIQIAGDRNAVLEAKAAIEQRVQRLLQEITTEHVDVSGKHQLIAGPNGAELHNLLEETGCAFIIPPQSHNAQELIVTGPRSQIEKGVDAIQGITLGISSMPVNIGQIFQNNQAHARALTRHLKQREILSQLEKQYNALIVLPQSEDEPMIWTLTSREGKNLFSAQKDIKNIAAAYPQSRFQNLDLDPFYHELLREHHAKRLREEHGVHLLLPTASPGSSKLVLVHEGSGDAGILRQAPSPSDIAASKESLREAQAIISSLTNGKQPIATKEVEGPSKFQDKIRKFVRTSQNDLPEQVLPIQLMTRVQSVAQESGPRATQFSLRGPADRLDTFANSILAFIEQEKKDESERGYTTTFEFPKKHANFLIGKKGENINKLRQEFDVDIQVDDGKVKLTGPPGKAEKAKAKIISMGKKLDDEATHILKIKPQYHPDLIGSKGSIVNRLQDRYNVRVQFPRSAPTQNDNGSVVNGSDAGASRPPRGNQAADEVVVRGPKKGADACKDEILSLLQYNVDNSHSATVSVAKSQIPSLIGQGGREMESIRQTTGAKVDVPSSSEAADANGRIELKIKGTQKQVDEAKKLLQSRAKVFDESITKNVVIDKKHHSALIGAGGSNIRRIYEDAGGSEGPRGVNKTIRFPPRDSADANIRVEGHKTLVEKIALALETFAKDKEDQSEELIEVAPHKHSVLIGHGGNVRKALESEFNVSIDIPKKTATGDSRSQVKLGGKAANLAKAKERILEMVKEQENETVQVPRSIHHIVADRGALPRRLRNNYGVVVDHAGQAPKGGPPAASARANGASAPLITDDNDGNDIHSWNVVKNLDEDEREDVPWILKGKPEDIAKAISLLEAAIKEAKTQTHKGFLILPDPSTYGLVIGPGGSQIKAIRAETGCNITIPKDKTKSEAIEIVGTEEGTEAAKDIILDIVKNSRGGRS